MAELQPDERPQPSRARAAITTAIAAAVFAAVLLALFYAIENWRGRRAWRFTRPLLPPETLQPLGAPNPQNSAPASSHGSATVNAADGFQVWGETFEENSTNTFALQQQIAQRVTASVRALVLPEEDIGGLGSLRAGMER